MQGDRVQRVFVIVLILNVAVAVVKAVFGVMAGSVSMVADALHSGFDSFSNVVGIVAMHLAGKPPDPEHPYGHGKIETLGTLVIGAMLLLTAAGILLEGYGRLITPVTPEITPITVGVMVGTLITNIIVSTYERRKGEEYQSQILIADSLHTRSDVFVSTAVLGGFLAIRLGYPAADPIIALGIGLLIARMGVGILYGAAEVLIDSMNLPCDPALVRAVVMDTLVSPVTTTSGAGVNRARYLPTSTSPSTRPSPSPGPTRSPRRWNKGSKRQCRDSPRSSSTSNRTIQREERSCPSS